MSTHLPYVEINPVGPVQSCVIWLHGLGADGHDFAGIVPELRLPPALGVRFIFPHAPRRPVTLNGGWVMPAWYDIADLDGLVREDAAGLQDSELALRALMAAEQARGVPPGRMVLAGFSQGGALALHTALRYPESLAGVMVLSAYLPRRDALAAERHGANQNTPIFMAHGDEDVVVRPAFAATARALLEQSGYGVEWHQYAMAHSVCPQEVEDIARWLRRVLSPPHPTASAPR